MRSAPHSCGLEGTIPTLSLLRGRTRSTLYNMVQPALTQVTPHEPLRWFRNSGQESSTPRPCQGSLDPHFPPIYTHVRVYIDTHIYRNFISIYIYILIILTNYIYRYFLNNLWIHMYIHIYARLDVQRSVAGKSFPKFPKKSQYASKPSRPQRLPAAHSVRLASSSSAS